MTSKDMAQQAELYITAVNQHDISIIEELYSDDATVEDPVGSEPRRGKEIIAMYREAFSKNIRAELTGAVRVAANFAVFPFHIALDNGDSTLEIEVIDLFEFDSDGYIRSMKAFWGPDNLTTTA